MGQEQSLLTRIASKARPIPYIAYSDPPYGPIGLRDDIYFFPIPSADGKSLALMLWWQMHSIDIWPLQFGAEIWCRGNLDSEWSLASLKRDQLDPQQYILFLECQASGDFATLQLRAPNAGSKSIMFPLQSIRPRKIAKGKSGPHVVAMTMLSGMHLSLPAWVEYHILHGVDEIYIYENTHDNQDVSVRTYLAPYIKAGIVIMVPFYKTLLYHYAPGWVQQQLLAVNHVIRSMDGYADWILLTDVDELPTLFSPASTSPRPLPIFQYRDHLDAAMEADPKINEFSMLNCFTSLQPWVAPPEPVVTFEDGVEVTTTPTLPPTPEPTRRYLDIPGTGAAELLPDQVHRFVTCNHDGYRSKVFVRPSLVTIESIHHVPAGNGTDNVQDPLTGIWLMHLSDHDTEGKGDQMTLDLSEVSRTVTDALKNRYKGSTLLVEEEQTVSGGFID